MTRVSRGTWELNVRWKEARLARRGDAARRSQTTVAWRPHGRDDSPPATDVTPYSVSLFTDCTNGSFHQAWLKSRVAFGAAGDTSDIWFGARGAANEVHPIPGFAADACTPQLGRPGPRHSGFRTSGWTTRRAPATGSRLSTSWRAATRGLPCGRSRPWRRRSRRWSRSARSGPSRQTSSGSARRITGTRPRSTSPGGASPQAVLRLLPRLESLEPLAPRPHSGKLFNHRPHHRPAGLRPTAGVRRSCPPSRS